MRHVVSAFRRTVSVAFLHRRDVFMRLEFAVAVAVVVLLMMASIATGAEPTLLDAAERGDRAAVSRMLSKGADANAPGPDGTTAIMYAASNGDVELLRALIKAGANVTLKNQLGTTAITEAAIIGSAPVMIESPRAVPRFLSTARKSHHISSGMKTVLFRFFRYLVGRAWMSRVNLHSSMKRVVSGAAFALRTCPSWSC